MNNRKLWTILIWASVILMFICAFEWVNVESYYEDESFIGKEVNSNMKYDLLTVKLLLAAAIVFFFISFYKLSKTQTQKHETHNNPGSELNQV